MRDEAFFFLGRNLPVGGGSDDMVIALLLPAQRIYVSCVELGFVVAHGGASHVGRTKD